MLSRLVLVVVGLAASVYAGPCDIYHSGGTPCVAAHSTTRALYSAYNGHLYEVKRADGKTTNVGVLSPGGVANAAIQDEFCKGTTCLISIIYDQSGKDNHLTQAPPGGAARGPEHDGYDKLAVATAAPIRVGGHKVYGVLVTQGTGYRNNKAVGTAKGDEAEGMYAVLDGTHYNTGCCFDYGNAETNSKDTGNGHMEAIYFGSGDGSGNGLGNGTGPWLMADLENGLFSGVDRKKNLGNPTIKDRFFTALLKGGPNKWALRGANAAAGHVSTYYQGVRPNAQGYNPMKKEGAIILGTGGDNSISGRGTFYEGAMTFGYPSDKTEDEVQANIVSAKYTL